MDKHIKDQLKGKRLLLLGGSLWKDAIKKIADEYEIVLVATGNSQNAGIFEIASEQYQVNSTDAEEMKKLIIEKKIDGVYMGGNEAVISAACVYLNELELPCYCKKNQWDSLQDKRIFKELCIRHNLPCVPEVKLEQVCEENVEFPVITKPADGCGSSGFTVCHNAKELKEGITKARTNSPTKQVIVEKFVKNDGVVVFYTVSNGKLYFSGLEDKYPVRYKEHGSYVGGLFVFESSLKEIFREKFEDNISDLVADLGIKEGSFWIEVFYDGSDFYFNEAGYRYGGSASIYPINYMYGINQVAADIFYALTGKSEINNFVSIIPEKVMKKKYYAVYPLYSRAGKVSEIRGYLTLQKSPEIVTVISKISLQDEIKESGTFSQAVTLIHFVFDDINELQRTIEKIHNVYKVLDQDGNNMIERMLNIKNVSLK